MSYSLSPEAFVDYLIDRHGLVDFVRIQLRGKPEKDWGAADWALVTDAIWHLSDRMWQPSREYVTDLYMMQVGRDSQGWQNGRDAAVETLKARHEMWKGRALTAEAALAASHPATRRKKI